MQIGKVVPVNITEELSKSYLDYAMSVIVARALPDIRDGLKPVHRRILYAMHLMNLHPPAAPSKSAKIVGEVLGKYHPHGDVPVYEALVRLAQDFSMRYPLVQGQGNFGSVDGDPPAAMRYTEVRLAKISHAMLTDIEKNTVNFVENFDATLKEPSYLPSLLPNLLLMGSEGIAVGMATKIPPHNLSEVINGTIAAIEQGKPIIEKEKHEAEVAFFVNKVELIASGKEQEITEEEIMQVSVNFDSEITIPELVKIIPGPDFPTGGAIYDGASLEEVYATGRGRIVVRGIAEIKEGKKGKSIIEITELPYQVNKAHLVSGIADLVHEKRLVGISALRDESDKDGMSVVIELKRDAKPKSVLNNLFKYTRLQTTFPANFVALVDGIPHTVNLKEMIVEYVKHRQKVVIRRTIFDLTQAKKRAHILEGLKIALDNLDEVIATIRKSKTQEEAKVNLIGRFGFSDIQATAILDMQLRRLAALEREKIENEYNELMKLIDSLVSVLKNPQKPLDIIKEELQAVHELYKDKRRTKIYKQKIGEFSEEDLTPNEEVLITVTKTGYVKRLPRNTYKQQQRGGKGVIGMSTKDEDEIAFLKAAHTHDTLLFFTDRGRVFGSRVWDIPESSRTSKGQALVNIINLDQGETIRSIVPIGNDNYKYLLMATTNGTVKKTSLKEFSNLRSNGLIAIKMDSKDRLVAVIGTSGEDQALLLTKEGKAIRFKESDVRPMGRATTGVRGILLKGADEVLGLEVFAPAEKSKDSSKKFVRDIFTLSEKGLGKRTNLEDFPLQKRGGQGVKAAVVSAKTGPLAVALMITGGIKEVIVTSKFAQVIKLPRKDIPQMGRSTQGVIIMRFADIADRVAAGAVLEKGDETEEGQE